MVKLNVTNVVWNGRENAMAYGTSYLNVIINDPPENGTCTVLVNPQLKKKNTDVTYFGELLLPVNLIL